MKTLITTLNAKFIHTSLSIRLLYVASYHDHDIDFKEYTIKDKLERIANDILDHHYDIVGFSCYIWNIDYILKVADLLKERKPEIVIILGGPEVTYEAGHFISYDSIDYVMSGEGEETFPHLLTAIENGVREVKITGVSYKGYISKEVACVDLKLVEALDSPYNLEQDKADKAKRILYFETSRGCPFQCQYCLSSLEKGLRFFSEDYLKKQLDIICHCGAKTVKLLDRSFNAKKEHAIMILDYIFHNYEPGMQFQFEINADVLQQPIIDFLKEHSPEGLLRFEVGIQSTYEPTNKAVKRMQNFERLSEVVIELMEDGCDLHLDLIAGLPFESRERFQKSFDDVFAFRAKELQLGFLKLLRGTSLRTNADDYGYIYQQHPPYEMISNKWMSKEDIIRIHQVEDMLEKYWNSGRFKRTMNAVMDQEASAFDFFYRLAIYYDEHHYKHIGYQLDEIFKCLDEFLEYHYHDLLLIDYYHLHKMRPKRWYTPSLDANERKQVIRELSAKYSLNQEELFRYGVVEELKDDYMVVVYKNNNYDFKLYPKQKEETL